MSTHVCRVCFTSNVRMFRIDSNSIGLQEMFEKVTSNKLHTHERPVTMCYICLPQLQKSHRFLKMCVTAQEILTNLIKSGLEVKYDSLGKLNLSSIQHLSLSVAPTQFLTLENDDSANESYQVAVNEELDEVEESTEINPIVKDELDEQNFHVEESMVSINFRNDDATNETSQETVNQELDEIVESADINYIVKDEIDDQNLHVEETMISINSNYDDAMHESSQVAVKEELNEAEESADINRIINVEEFSCNQCNKTFSQFPSLQGHMRIHTRAKPVSCNICAKTFLYRGALKRHLGTHNSLKPFNCNRCDKTLSCKSHLQEHMRTHTGEKPYACNICAKTFSASSNYHMHMRVHSGEKPHSCNLCDKNFYSTSSLQVHMRTHTGEKPYSCNICAESFANGGALKLHMVTHTGVKPFSCNRCDKDFLSNSHLQEHMRTHTGEKPYYCNICAKTFTASSNFHRHMKAHTGEKTYSCNICDKKFICKTHLRLHLSTHTGDKSFSCNRCDKAFSQSCHLQRHMNIHTEENFQVGKRMVSINFSTDETDKISQVSVNKEFLNLAEGSADIKHIVKDEMDDQNFHVEETIVSINSINDDAMNESSQVYVKEELDEAEESSDINHFLKDEIDDQNFNVEETMLSLNSINNDTMNESSLVAVKEELDLSE